MISFCFNWISQLLFIAIAGLGAKKGKSKQENTKITLAVETDAKKLVNYVCGSNLMQTGEDVQIKPDNEYPDWLWSVHTGKQTSYGD